MSHEVRPTFRQQVLPDLRTQTLLIKQDLGHNANHRQVYNPATFSTLDVHWPIREGCRYVHTDDWWVPDMADYDLYYKTALIGMRAQRHNRLMQGYLDNVCEELQRTRETLLEARYRPGGEGFETAKVDFNDRTQK